MTLQQIKYFLKVYSTGNLTTAANDLFITRSALSKAIKDLEDEYQIRLFERTKDGLVPTPAGLAVKEKAKELIKVSDELDNMLSEVSGQSDDYIYVGITPLTGIHVLNSVYGSFLSKHPEYHIIPIEGSKQQADTFMRSGQMDVSFAIHSDAFADEKGGLRIDPNFNSQIVGETELVFMASTKSKYAKKKSISIEDISDEEFVFFKKPLQWEYEIDYRFKKIGKAPRVYTRVAHPPVLRTIISNGKAYSIQMRGVLGNTENIVEIPLDPVAKYKVSMVWSPKAEEKPAAKAFIDHCLKALK